MPTHRDRRTHRDHTGLQPRAFRARSRRERDVPHLTLVVDDLHRAVGAREAHIRLQLARELELVGLLTGPTVMSRCLQRNEPQTGARQTNE